MMSVGWIWAHVQVAKENQDWTHTWILWQTLAYTLQPHLIFEFIAVRSQVGASVSVWEIHSLRRVVITWDNVCSSCVYPLTMGFVLVPNSLWQAWNGFKKEGGGLVRVMSWFSDHADDETGMILNPCRLYEVEWPLIVPLCSGTQL